MIYLRSLLRWNLSKFLVHHKVGFFRYGVGGFAPGKEQGVSLSDTKDRRVKRPWAKPTSHVWKTLVVVVLVLGAFILPTTATSEPRLDFLAGKSVLGRMWTNETIATDDQFIGLLAHYINNSGRGEYSLGLSLSYGEINYRVGGSKKNGNTSSLGLGGSYRVKLGLGPIEHLRIYALLVPFNTITTVALKRTNINEESKLSASRTILFGNLGMEAWVGWQSTAFANYLLPIPRKWSYGLYLGFSYLKYNRIFQQFVGQGTSSIKRGESTHISRMIWWLGTSFNTHIF